MGGSGKGKQRIKGAHNRCHGHDFAFVPAPSIRPLKSTLVAQTPKDLLSREAKLPGIAGPAPEPPPRCGRYASPLGSVAVVSLFDQSCLEKMLPNAKRAAGMAALF
jgi:hypothetical protein